MGAPRQPVQCANAKRGMGMHMVLVLMCLVRLLVAMDMDVGFAVVLVFMHMEPVGKRKASAPDPNGDQHHANEPLAPAGDGFQRQQFPEAKKEQANQDHTGSVAGTPPGPGKPGSIPALHRRNGRHCSKMVRPGEHMN